MPDSKNNLYLYEALALRDAYDRQIDLLEEVLGETSGLKNFRSIGSADMARRQPADGFNEKEMRETLKKMRIKRVKLNNEIQAVNFTVKFEFEGESISVAEGLEIRKSIKEELKTLEDRVNASAYNNVIHKEERDIIEKPRFSFVETYSEYLAASTRLRMIQVALRAANHSFAVSFKDE